MSTYMEMIIERKIIQLAKLHADMFKYLEEKIF